MKHIKDLREYIDALSALGDIQDIKRPVDAYLEMAAIVRHGYDLRSPAPLFHNINGSQSGMRALGAPAAASSVAGMPAARVALSVGLDPKAGWAEIVDCLARSRTARPIPPRRIATAACKENILHGKEAKLDIFPIPYLHEGDGGPYCNTWGTIVVRTPDGQWTNWSIARIQKLDAYRMTGLIAAPQHVGRIWEAWRKIGKPMPYALIQGGEPGLPIVSSMPLADGVSEADYLGGHFGEAIDVVACETIDLDVPASAEIVIEGHVSLEREAKEGPFGEYPGYLSTETSLQPIYHVECITHRHDAIWPFVPEGRPVDDYHTAFGVAASAEILGILRETGLPVSMAWQPLEMANHWLLVTVPEDWRTTHPDLSSEQLTKEIATAVWHSKFGFMCPILYVLDDDIDPTRPEDFLWALPTRTHPSHRTYVTEGPILSLIACYSEEERHKRRADHVAHDCLLPAPGQGRLRHSSFEGAYPREIQEKVLRLWNQ